MSLARIVQAWLIIADMLLASVTDTTFQQVTRQSVIPFQAHGCYLPVINFPLNKQGAKKCYKLNGLAIYIIDVWWRLILGEFVCGAATLLPVSLAAVQSHVWFAGH